MALSAAAEGAAGTCSSSLGSGELHLLGLMERRQECVVTSGAGAACTEAELASS